MIYKGPELKAINRFGHKFVSDNYGILEVDIDSLKKSVIEIDGEGKEFTSRDSLTEDEKKELLSAIKAYGFKEVVEGKEKK